MSFSQVPHTLLLVRPAFFGYNPETAASNAFQKQPTNESQVQEKALAEFDTAVGVLTKKGIATLVVEDTLEPLTTDAIFPNNWITMHEDGKVILYPMMAPSRRNERRSDVIDMLKKAYQVHEVIDLSVNENQNQFLEGTGSIIFDHLSKIAYACKSDRTNEGLFNELCTLLEYKPILFDAVDEIGTPIYHTNVMMWIGESLIGICLDAIKSEAQQEIILNEFEKAGRRVIALSYAQMNSFAGNMLEVKDNSAKRYMLMSQAAYDSLLPGQLAEIGKHAEPLPVNIPTIEESGGGSIRCMIAGIHLPIK